MKRPGFLLSFAAGLFLAASAFAVEPVKVSIPREQVFKLREALEKIEPGLTPANTVVAADNLTALQPIADGVAKASLRMQREQVRVPDGPERAVRLITLADDFDAKMDEPVEVELTPLELTSDEIKEARIAPRYLTFLRRYLRPKKAP